MVLVKIPLRNKKNELYTATVGVNDKYLYDEVDTEFEKMISGGIPEKFFGWGPFEVSIKSKKAA